MLPARTASLPNFLTPRRRPAESRPLRELPPAFLCAMTSCSSALLLRLAGRLLRRRLLRGGLLRLGRRLPGLGGFRLGLAFGLRLGLRLRLVRGLLQLGLRAAGQDVGDAHHGQQLAVALLAPVVVAPLLLEDDDLVALALLEHGGDNGRALDQGRADALALALAGRQDLGEGDIVARLAGQLLDEDDVVFGD